MTDVPRRAILIARISRLGRQADLVASVIGQPAAEQGRFVPPFSRARMTWTVRISAKAGRRPCRKRS
jgi:hypothetical protein